MSKKQLIVRGLLWGGLFLLSTIFIWLIHFPFLGQVYTPDSYDVFVMGKSFFSGTGFSNWGIRDLTASVQWPSPSRGYAPLAPFFAGLINQVFNTGIHSLAYFNLLIMTITLFVFAFVFHRLSGVSRWVYSGMYLLFLSVNIFLELEVAAARSIPLSILIFFGTLLVIFESLDPKKPLLWSYSVGIGVTALYLVRFEQLIFALCFPIIYFFIARFMTLSSAQAKQRTVRVVSAMFVVCLPWMVRNVFLFGTPFATDSQKSALYVKPVEQLIVFYANGNWPQMIWQDPIHWFTNRLGLLAENIWSFLDLTYGFGLLSPLMFGIAWKLLPRIWRATGILVYSHTLLTLSTISLTNHPEPRYYSIQGLCSWGMALGTFLIVNQKLLPKFKLIKKHLKTRNIVTAMVTIIMIGLSIIKNDFTPLDAWLTGYNVPVIPDMFEQRKKEFFYSLNVSFRTYILPSTVVGLGYGQTPYSSQMYYYYLGYRTVMIPLNVTEVSDDLLAWRDRWNVQFLILVRSAVQELGLDQYVIATARGTDYCLIDAQALRKP